MHHNFYYLCFFFNSANLLGLVLADVVDFNSFIHHHVVAMSNCHDGINKA